MIRFHGEVANWAVENRKAGSPWQRSFSESDRLAAENANRAIAHGRFRAGFHLGILKVAGKAGFPVELSVAGIELVRDS